MKFLFLICILMTISNCFKIKIDTSKNKSSMDDIPSYNSNDIFILDSSHKIISNITSLNISTNPTFLNSNSNYVLSYGLTPNLYLLQSLNNLERYGYKLEYIPIELRDSMTDGTISNNNYYVSSDEGTGYIAMYYSSEYNKYYIVENIDIVSNIHTLFSNINTSIQEPYYIDHYHAIPESNITYIADITTNQRLYYKPDNNTYLLKELWPIIDFDILYFTNSTTEAIRIPLSSNIIIHPFKDEDGYLTYTNNTGIVFERNIYNSGSLNSSDSNFILESNDSVD